MMIEGQQALARVKQLIPEETLTYIEEAVFIGAWDGKRYRDMALELGYDEGYLKDTGSQLWRMLSDRLGKEVTKKRIRLILLDDASQVAAIAHPAPYLMGHGREPLKLPGSPLSSSSPLYVRRPPLEQLCFDILGQPGGLVRIKAPKHTGKTSLINCVMDTVQASGMRAVYLDIRQVDPNALGNFHGFLQWFCWTVGQQLGVSCDFEQDWFEGAGSKLSCTILMQNWLANHIEEAVVIAIDTVHHLVDYPSIASNFFLMLRSWYEKASVHNDWQKLRTMMAYVNELDAALPPHQSPFNVGLHLEISPFTQEQVRELSERYGYDSTKQAATLDRLFTLIGGHPYLWNLVLYWLCSGYFSPEQIMEDALTSRGIFRDHLQNIVIRLRQNAALVAGLQQLIESSEPIYLEPQVTTSLKELGLIQLVGIRSIFACELYRNYFTAHHASRAS